MQKFFKDDEEIRYSLTDVDYTRGILPPIEVDEEFMEEYKRIMIEHDALQKCLRHKQVFADMLKEEIMERIEQEESF